MSLATENLLPLQLVSTQTNLLCVIAIRRCQNSLVVVVSFTAHQKLDPFSYCITLHILSTPNR